MEHSSRMRKQILCKLYDHLRRNYSFAWSKQLFLGSGFSSEDLQVVPGFRRDVKLETLRMALESIDKGLFGTCLRCKQEIAESILDVDPSRRFCERCEREMMGGTFAVQKPHSVGSANRNMSK